MIPREKKHRPASRITLFALCLLWFSNSTCLTIAQEDEFRAFTDKQGRNVTAKVVSVSSDQTIMTIADQSGNTYDLVIVKLCLDDQQYLKDWIAAQPVSSKYRLDVEIEKIRADSKERHKASYFRAETEHSAYRIRVSNLSRDTLTKAKLEYVIVKRERVKVYRTSPPERRLTFDRVYDADQGPDIKWNEHDIEDLPFNRDQEFITDSIAVDQVFEESSKPSAEDLLLGLIVRIRDESDKVIGDFYSADPGISGEKWESFVPEGDLTAGQGFLKTRTLTEMPETLQQGDAVDEAAVPSPVGKKVRITSTVQLDNKEASGIIFQWGGHLRGFAIEITDGRLRWWVRRAETEETSKAVDVSTRVTELPDREFLLEVTLDNEKLSISVDGVEKNQRLSPGLLTEQPGRGITVGHQAGTPVAIRSAASNFTGKVKDLRVILSD